MRSNEVIVSVIILEGHNLPVRSCSVVQWIEYSILWEYVLPSLIQWMYYIDKHAARM